MLQIIKAQNLKLWNVDDEVVSTSVHQTFKGVFASLVAPFGGFFASGFKRAFKIKDFGALIPGHGGLMGKYGTYFNPFSQTSMFYNEELCTCQSIMSKSWIIPFIWTIPFIRKI